MACDTAYPVPEETVAGIFAIGCTLIEMTFYILYMFPSLGTAWTNWSLAISECICIPIMFFYSGNAKRVDEDEQAENVNSSNINASCDK